MATTLNRAFLLLLAVLLLAQPARAEEPGRIVGLGGLFVKSPDPKALAKWYREMLGLELQPWGGAVMRYDADHHPSYSVWSAFPAASDMMAPSTREFMVNFVVDDLDALVARITSKGGTILKRDDSDPNGHFAWIIDPDGTKVELWQPKRK